MIDVVTLPGNTARYALGLTWRRDAELPVGGRLRALAAKRGRYGVIDHAGVDFQVGLGDLPRKVWSTRRIQPLALVIADQNKRPWSGLYDLGDGRHWLIAVTGDRQIVPGSDRVGTLEEMRAAQEALTRSDTWAMHTGTLDTIAKMVSRASPQPSLRDLKAVLSTPMWIALALAAVVVGYTVWHGHYLKEQRVRMARLAADQQAAAAAVPPWTRMPSPSGVLAACRSAWLDPRVTRLAVAGWTLSSWTCAPHADSIELSLGWRNAGGLAIAAPGTLIDASSSREVITRAVAFENASAPAVGLEAASRAILTLAQLQAMSLTLTDAASSGVPQSATLALMQTQWQVLKADFTMTAPPWTASVPGFDDVPALRLSAIGWSAGGSNQGWTVDAILYTLKGSSGQAVSTSLPGGAS